MTQLKQHETLESFKSKLKGKYSILLAINWEPDGSKRLMARLIIDKLGTAHMDYVVTTSKDGDIPFHDDLASAIDHYLES